MAGEPTALVADASADLDGAGVLTLAAAAFVVSVGYGASMPVVPGWLAALQPSLSAPAIARLVGELSGVYMLGVFAGALAAGHVSDLLGRRPVVLTGMLVFVVVQLAIVDVESLVLLYALRFTAGLAGAAVIPVATALVVERSARGQAARRVAALSAASLLGFLLGPGLVSLPEMTGLDVRLGLAGPAALFSFAMHVTAALGAVVMVAVWRLRLGRSAARRRREGEATARAIGNLPLLVLLALNFLTLLGLGGFEVALSLDGSQRLGLTPSRISLMFAECSVVMLLINAILFFTPLPRTLRPRAVLIVSMAAMLGGFVLLYRSVDYALVLAAVALLAAGSGLAMPVITWTAANHAPRLGAAMGRLAAAGSLGQAMGSVAAGWMFSLLSARTFLLGALFMLVAMLVAWIGVRGRSAITAPAPEPP